MTMQLRYNIHGGDWRGGSKKGVPGWLRRFVNDGKLSVVAVEYRLTDVATHPAQVIDCLRSIQFVWRTFIRLRCLA